MSAPSAIHISTRCALPFSLCHFRFGGLKIPTLANKGPSKWRVLVVEKCKGLVLIIGGEESGGGGS